MKKSFVLTLIIAVLFIATPISVIIKKYERLDNDVLVALAFLAVLGTAMLIVMYWPYLCKLFSKKTDTTQTS